MPENVTKIPKHINYLCIEGVIGAGKTSLCNLLAKRINGRLMLEAVNDNPFLTDFYKNRKSAAFQTQLWFILSRYRQLSENFAQQDLFHHVTVSDYIFAKDSLFASINLDENELVLYNTIAKIIEKKIPRPDFVIYLQASTDILLKRIEKRGRPYEYNMDKAYIKMLNEVYNQFFFHYQEAPVLIVNTNEIDLLNDDENLNDIIEQIHTTKFGSNYYCPLPSTDRAIIDEKKEKS